MVYIVMCTADKVLPFLFDAPVLGQDQWLFGISHQGIGIVGMLLNFAVTLVVSSLTPPPPAEVVELIENVRLPDRLTAEALMLRLPERTTPLGGGLFGPCIYCDFVRCRRTRSASHLRRRLFTGSRLLRNRGLFRCFFSGHFLTNLFVRIYTPYFRCPDCYSSQT